MTRHTITIEPLTLYPCEIATRAVVERFGEHFKRVCVRADQLPYGASLTIEAQRYARLYHAEYVAEVTR